jgi:hypothetical protein
MDFRSYIEFIRPSYAKIFSFITAHTWERDRDSGEAKRDRDSGEAKRDRDSGEAKRELQMICLQNKHV